MPRLPSSSTTSTIARNRNSALGAVTPGGGGRISSIALLRATNSASLNSPSLFASAAANTVSISTHVNTDGSPVWKYRISTIRVAWPCMRFMLTTSAVNSSGPRRPSELRSMRSKLSVSRSYSARATNPSLFASYLFRTYSQTVDSSFAIGAADSVLSGSSGVAARFVAQPAKSQQDNAAEHRNTWRMRYLMSRIVTRSRVRRRLVLQR